MAECLVNSQSSETQEAARNLLYQLSSVRTQVMLQDQWETFVWVESDHSSTLL